MSVIKRIIQEITPPVIRKGSVFLSGKRKKETNGSVPAILTAARVKPKSLKYLAGRPVFSLPVSRLRYLGGLKYTYEQHHFLQYYREGPSGLIRYYENHQPKNIFEKHFLPTPKNRNLPHKGDFVNTWLFAVPWLYTQEEGAHNGEKGLANKHGDQAFGPVSDKKIKLEKYRLDSVLHSIKKTGFRPHSHDGYPRGYFLIDSKGDWVFLICLGFHRVAALVHLGYTSIPVQFEPTFPRTIEQDHCAEWPMVKKELLTKSEASDIFLQYMRGSVNQASL